MGSSRLENSSIDKFESSRIIILGSLPSLSCAWPFYPNLHTVKITQIKVLMYRLQTAMKRGFRRNVGRYPQIQSAIRLAAIAYPLLKSCPNLRSFESLKRVIIRSLLDPDDQRKEIVKLPITVWDSKTAPHCHNISVIRLWAWVGLFIFVATVMISGSRHYICTIDCHRRMQG